jgi:hypothetical protein
MPTRPVPFSVSALSLLLIALAFGPIAPGARAEPPVLDDGAFSARFETTPIRIVGSGPKPSKLVLTVDRKLVEAARHAAAIGTDPIYLTVNAVFQPNRDWAVALSATVPRAGLELQPIPHPTAVGSQIRQHTQLRFRPDLACPARGACRISLTTQVQSDPPLHPSQGAPRGEPRPDGHPEVVPTRMDIKAYHAARSGPIVVTVVVSGPAAAAPIDIKLRTSGRNLTFVTRTPKRWPTPPPPNDPAIEPAPPTPVESDRGPRPARLDACDTDNDCTTTCFVPDNCCASQCRSSCAYAVNRWFIAELRADHESRCRQQRCPAVGCALDDTMWLAQCREGRCVAVKGFGKGFGRGF